MRLLIVDEVPVPVVVVYGSDMHGPKERTETQLLFIFSDSRFMGAPHIPELPRSFFVMCGR
jgi:hypothetical protein